jgi:hypothetical protein
VAYFLISVLSYISSNLNSYCMRLTISHIHAIGTSVVVELRLYIPDYELSNLILKKKTKYAFKYELCSMDPMIIDVFVA